MSSLEIKRTPSTVGQMLKRLPLKQLPLVQKRGVQPQPQKTKPASPDRTPRAAVDSASNTLVAMNTDRPQALHSKPLRS
jgi:hypothetical protein